MTRKALSFTMTMIVSALVLLATALLVIGINQGFLSDVQDRSNQTATEKWNDIELEQKRGDCKIHMEQYCTGSAKASSCPTNKLDDDQKWACNFRVDGTWCWKYWKGAEATIPRCDEVQQQGSGN